MAGEGLGQELTEREDFESEGKDPRSLEELDSMEREVLEDVSELRALEV